MADFKIAYQGTSVNEGGYANDPDDHGGETWKGISRNNETNWIGWHIVDMYKKLPNFPKNLYASSELEKAVQDIYKSNYWNLIRGDEINFQDCANDLYDSAVNVGVGTAIILAKRAAGLPEDTHMDNEFLNFLNHKL
ncbi:MAG TPA: glycosyl hydrolase 108 family protein [Hanamia sp.]|nr:glycosyl hydrolase 108 family protein [Hanamia sp.]